MGSKIIVSLGLLLTVVLLISSEVAAREMAETANTVDTSTKEADGQAVDDTRFGENLGRGGYNGPHGDGYGGGYNGGQGGGHGGGYNGGQGGGHGGGYNGGYNGGQGGGHGGGYNGGGHGGGYNGGGNGGSHGGGCRHGCCGKGYNGCRCCTYAGEKPDAEPQN